MFTILLSAPLDVDNRLRVFVSGIVRLLRLAGPIPANMFPLQLTLNNGAAHAVSSDVSEVYY